MEGTCVVQNLLLDALLDRIKRIREELRHSSGNCSASTVNNIGRHAIMREVAQLLLAVLEYHKIQPHIRDNAHQGRREARIEP